MSFYLSCDKITIYRGDYCEEIFSLLTIGLLLLLVGKPTPEEPVEKELGKVEKVLVIGNSF